MPAKATGEAVGAIIVLPAVGRRSAGKTRQRPRLTHAERFDDLRRRLASTENILKIGHVKAAAALLAKQADEQMRARLSSFIGLCAAKQQRVRAPLKPKRAVPLLLGGMCPQVKMVATEWTTDANGVMSREIFGVDAGAP
jgi:hypothetical protein